MNKWEEITNSWTEDVEFDGETYILSTKEIFNSDRSQKWELVWRANDQNLQVCNLKLERDCLSKNYTLWLNYRIEVDSNMKCDKNSHMAGIGMFHSGCSSLVSGNCQMLQFDTSHEKGKVSFYVKLMSIITNVHFPRSLPDVVAPQDFGLVKGLASVFNNHEFSDVQIFVGETKLYAHKIILCARSPVFRAMCQEDLLEKQPGRIDINNFNVDVVKWLIRFLYEGHVTIPSMDIASELLKAAAFYNVVDLKDLCVKYISDNVDRNNVLDVLLLSSLYDANELNTFAVEYFLTYPKQYDSSEFKEIEQLKPDLLSAILAIVTGKYAESTLVLDGFRKFDTSG